MSRAPTVPALEVLGSLNLGDPSQRPGLTATRDAVRDLMAAASFAVTELSAPGAPTRPEREAIVARLNAALAGVGAQA